MLTTNSGGGGSNCLPFMSYPPSSPCYWQLKQYLMTGQFTTNQPYPIVYITSTNEIQQVGTSTVYPSISSVYNAIASTQPTGYNTVVYVDITTPSTSSTSPTPTPTPNKGFCLGSLCLPTADWLIIAGFLVIAVLIITFLVAR
mgnify:CR=1 FL=1